MVVKLATNLEVCGMKTIKEFVRVIIAATVMASSIAGVFAQTPDAAGNKTRQRLVTKNPEQAKTTAQDTKSNPNAKPAN